MNYYMYVSLVAKLEENVKFARLLGKGVAGNPKIGKAHEYASVAHCT